MQVLLRHRLPADLPFVFDSWMKSWRLSKYAGVLRNNRFYEEQRGLIEDLLARGAVILIAHPSDQADVILGWACGEVKEEKCVLHYVYVKDPFLGLGLTEQLVEALPGAKPGFITHKLPSKAIKDWRHTPEMARRKVL